MVEARLPRYELLVGSEAFWLRAEADIAAARRRVLIQAMTFEGDAVGLAVAASIMASGAFDRRVLVDDYTRHNLNDTMLAFSRDAGLAAEARATREMFDDMQCSGVGLRITNPVGRNPFRFALRNHKKLLVMDDAVWLGGINFSDHNFAWHDMMVRVEHKGIADWLAGEFERDWAGRAASNAARIEGAELLSLDGARNAEGFSSLLDTFSGARHSIEVISAYPTFPFVEAMAAAASRGVPVTLYTPRPNNKPVVRDYLLGTVAGNGLTIRLVPEMTHAKAALIDRAALVVGSSNFDFVIYRANAEYVAVLRDDALIADFETRMLDPLRANSAAAGPADHSPWRSLVARFGLRIADLVISLLEHGPRIAKWPAT